MFQVRQLLSFMFWRSIEQRNNLVINNYEPIPWGHVYTLPWPQPSIDMSSDEQNSYKMFSLIGNRDSGFFLERLSISEISRMVLLRLGGGQSIRTLTKSHKQGLILAMTCWLLSHRTLLRGTAILHFNVVASTTGT